MKQLMPLILLLAATLLCSACISRTYTTKSGGENQSEKKLLWIWQDEYRSSK